MDLYMNYRMLGILSEVFYKIILTYQRFNSLSLLHQYTSGTFIFPSH